MAGHDEGTIDLLPIETAYQFPVNYFVENLAVRKTGQLLLTVHNREELLQLDPHSGAPPSVLHKFASGVCGIVEVEDDVFYVSSGDIGAKGSWAIFRVDVSESPPDVKKLADVPDALFLNGSTVLDRSAGVILAVDSVLGMVFRINVKNAHVDTWIQDKALGKATENPMIPGANGIKPHDGYVYISNTDAKTFLRVHVAPSGDATGEISQVADNLNIDDFAFDNEGSAYLTTHIFQSVVKLQANGTRSRIAGGPDDPVVAGTTAAAFGRTANDRTVLYVTTTGGMSLPVAGKVEPARVLKIDVGHAGEAF